MPTGYTCVIEEGCSFEEYAWRCARAFGALVSMRDSDIDEPVPQQLQIGDYYVNSLAQAKQQLQDFQNKTPAELQALYQETCDAVAKRNQEYIQEHELKKEQYMVIKAQAEAWVPPTRDHVEMKNFMLSQIETSEPREKPWQEEPITDTIDAWIKKQIKLIKSNIDYAKDNIAKEQASVDRRNAWINALRESIPQPLS